MYYPALNILMMLNASNILVMRPIGVEYTPLSIESDQLDGFVFDEHAAMQPILYSVFDEYTAMQPTFISNTYEQQSDAMKQMLPLRPNLFTFRKFIEPKLVLSAWLSRTSRPALYVHDDGPQIILVSTMVDLRFCTLTFLFILPESAMIFSFPSDRLMLLHCVGE